MKSSYEILKEMSGILEKKSYSKARLLLLDESLQTLGENPSRVEVGGLLPTLNVRKKITMQNGKEVYGLSQLIEIFSNLNDVTVINGFGYISSDIVGIFYYLELEDKPLGATIIERDHSHEKFNWEAVQKLNGLE